MASLRRNEDACRLSTVSALVAEDAVPVRFAVIVPALKLPLASRATTLLAVLAEVASTAHVVAALPLKLEPVKYVPRVRVFVVLAVTVMFALPLNDTPLIVLAVWSVVAVVALPDSAPENVVALIVVPVNVPVSVPPVRGR